MSEKIYKYYALFKPYGYLSQFVCSHKNKKLLGQLYPFDVDVMPVGRLDEDSEGLILLSNQGKFHKHLLAHKTEKEYWVLVEGEVSEQTIAQLCAGVKLSHKSETYLTKPAVVKIINTPNFAERTPRVRYHPYKKHTWLSITIKEGKFRQVRKMTAVVGHPTLRLIRMRIGALMFHPAVPAGMVVELNPADLDYLLLTESGLTMAAT